MIALDHIAGRGKPGYFREPSRSSKTDGGYKHEQYRLDS